MFRIFKKLTPKQWGLAALSVVFIVLQVYLDLKVPDYMSDITTLLQTPGTQTSDLYSPGGTMLGLSLLSFASSIIVGFFAARLAAGLTWTLRGEVYGKVMEFSTAEIQQFSVPSLITRTTNDITQIQMLVAMGMQVVVKGPIMAIWAITKIAGKNFNWTMVTLAAVVVLLITIMSIMLVVRPLFKKIQEETDALNAITRENLTGVRVVRAYNAEEFQTGKFNQINSDLTGMNLTAGRVLGLISPVMTLISSGLTLAIYYVGALMINEAALTDKIGLFSDMVVFTSYAMQVVFGFIMMAFIFMILPRSIVSARRINEVLDMKSSVAFDSASGPKAGNDVVVSFQDVDFQYPDATEAVVEDVTFEAKTGDTIALIGSTGSGKSTVVNLLPRYFDRTRGEILLHGTDIRKYSEEELLNRIGYIPQKAVLFSGTIRSNMMLGKSSATPLSDDDMWEALEIAQAADFVRNLPEGLDAPVAQNGSNFSGGQRQRLAIARVLARKPEVLIFDDSFSALDFKTDKALRHELATKLHDTTKIIVAQRISTIMDATEILVMEQGQVVGHGTHDQLLKDNTYYQEIAYSQLSKEELEHGNH